MMQTMSLPAAHHQPLPTCCGGAPMMRCLLRRHKQQVISP
jgi:hypothetical protein